ncbi:MAG: hypothetical protein WA790_15600 [Sulfitobacter sp.]
MYVPRRLSVPSLQTTGCPMIFVQTPNCGGAFVAQTFGRAFQDCITMTDPKMRGHPTLRRYRVGLSRHNLDIADFYTFDLVRNPWHWHQSWYSFVKQDTGGMQSGMPVEHALFQNITFLEYLRWLDCPGITGLRNRHYLREMSEWLIGSDGQIGVDHVLRYETLNQDLHRLSDTYGLRLNMPQIHSKVLYCNPNSDVSYCTEGIEIIRKRHARDIALFGYVYEDQAACETVFG